MIKATIESIRLRLWVIYDDLADWDRTVVMSDAYYGDSGSLAELCKSLGVPLMIQNVEIM